MTSVLSILANEQSRETEKDLLEAIKNTKKAGAFDYSVEFDNRLYRRTSLFGDVFNENLFNEDSLAAGNEENNFLNEDIDLTELNDFVEEIRNEVTAPTNTHGEIFIPAEAMAPTVSNGCASATKRDSGSSDVNYWTLDFDQTTLENCFFTIRMPEDWDARSVTFQFIWAAGSISLSGQTVAWGIKGSCRSDISTLNASYGTEVTTTDTYGNNSANQIHFSGESSPVTPSGTLGAGKWCQFNIARKVASDNLAADAQLIGIRLKYGRV